MAEGEPHHAKGSKKHSLIRSEKNRKSGKYKRQRERTERNKANRIERMNKRFPKYLPVGWIKSRLSGKWIRA